MLYVTLGVMLASSAASGSPIHAEGDVRLEFVGTAKKCNMKCLDADVKRPLASLGAIVDEANDVVCGPQDSYIEIPVSRRKGVAVVAVGPREWL